MIDAAENEESLEPEDRRQRPRAGSVELSPTGTEWNARGFAYSNPDRNVYLWSCAGGDSSQRTACLRLKCEIPDFFCGYFSLSQLF